MDRKDVLKYFSLLNQAESINRFSRDKLVNDENVLQHIGWVCLWSYLVANKINQQFDVYVAYEDLLCGAVTHDIDEVVTGDIPRVTKYANDDIRREMKKLEKEAVENVGDSLGDSDIFGDWYNAKGRTTIERYIIKTADIAAVVYKLWDEVIRLNNYSMLRVAEEVLLVVRKERDKGIGPFDTEIRLFFTGMLDSLFYITNDIIESIPDSKKELIHTLEYKDENKTSTN